MMMKFLKKQLLALSLVMAMLLASMPLAVFAAPETQAELEARDESSYIEDETRSRLPVEALLDRMSDDEASSQPLGLIGPLAQVTLDEDFEDDAVVVVLRIEASRDDRTFTARDFGDIGALYVEDLDRLSRTEHIYAQALWEAEENLDAALVEFDFFVAFTEGEHELSPEDAQVILEAYEVYLEIREEAEANTLVNFDEYRRILLIRLDQNCQENVFNVIRYLQQHEDIYLAEPNYIFESEMIRPNDPYFLLPPTNINHQWAIDRLSLPQAWEITTGASTVRVGIVGHGIDAHHPELIGRVSALSGGQLTDPGAMGTMQAGIIGASGNNGIGIAGISWNVQLVSVAADGNHVTGIANARAAGIPILSRSFTGGASNTTIYTAARNFTGLFVNSAGNDNQNTDLSPRFPHLEHVIVVGASDMNDGRSVWNATQSSNFGRTSVHLFAPGGGIVNGVSRNIRTTSPNNSFGFYSGTSASAPHVAGVAALVLSVNPNLSPQQVRDILVASVDPLPAFENISISGGRLNAYNALRQAQVESTRITLTHNAPSATAPVAAGVHGRIPITVVAPGNMDVTITAPGATSNATDPALFNGAGTRIAFQNNGWGFTHTVPAGSTFHGFVGTGGDVARTFTVSSTWTTQTITLTQNAPSASFAVGEGAGGRIPITVVAPANRSVVITAFAGTSNANDPALFNAAGTRIAFQNNGWGFTHTVPAGGTFHGFVGTGGDVARTFIVNSAW